MKIAIISDTHDNLIRIKQMLDKIKEDNIQTIIHCGDVCTSQTLTYLCQNFDGQIYLSLGNVDADHQLNPARNAFPNLTTFSKFGELNIADYKIAFVHFPNSAKKLANNGKYSFVFYGHTHQARKETINNCQVINPGTLAGLFAKSTFAILDLISQKTQLIILT